MAKRALGPAALQVVQAVRAAVAPGERLLVACSGGPDSLALAAATAQLGAAGTVTVDHGLQPGSADQAAATADQLRRLGLTATVVTVQIDPRDQTGPEAAARTARYAALGQAADDSKADAVLLGHTLDDQAETVLLGLARGSGPRSLSGMADRQGPYRRPLLGLPRTVTVQACAEWDLSPWSDPQNADPRFTRVRVRDRVLPVLERELGPGVAAALARTAALGRADADHLDTLAAAADPGSDTLDTAELQAQPEAIRRRVLRRWLTRRGAADVHYDHVRAVDALVTDWRGQQALHLPGVRVSREQGRLVARPR